MTYPADATTKFRTWENRRSTTCDVAHVATYDALTGLPNRALFLDRLDRAIAHAWRHAGTLAVLFRDRARFRHINGSFARAIADRLPQPVAEQ